MSKQADSSLAFVVQLHQAAHLHYDFRLELNGVLKSWAVPKGPSMYPHDKRLAIMVEDHPYAYKDFEGVIPEGSYGAGTVKIWDKGYYTDEFNSEKKQAVQYLNDGLNTGHLNFILYGKKLKGMFSLIRMKSREDNAWLLIKQDDAFAEHNS